MKNRDESLAGFFLLVFTLSLPFWLLGSLFPIELLPGLPLSAIGSFTPGLSALILIYRKERFTGVLRLLKRSFDFKRIRGKAWYLLIILINPAISILAYGITRIIDTSIPVPMLPTPALVPLFLFFFIGALGEEIGWSGYATEPLENRLGILTAGLLLGAVWAVWHFIPLIQAHRSAYWIAWWTLATVSARVIMVWLYIRSGKSLFGVALYHAISNLCWQFYPINGSYYDPRTFGLITAGFAIVFMLIEWRVFKKD